MHDVIDIQTVHTDRIEQIRCAFFVVAIDGCSILWVQIIRTEVTRQFAPLFLLGGMGKKFESFDYFKHIYKM